MSQIQNDQSSFESCTKKDSTTPMSNERSTRFKTKSQQWAEQIYSGNTFLCVKHN
jgi:hypothetical protein